MHTTIKEIVGKRHYAVAAIIRLSCGCVRIGSAYKLRVGSRYACTVHAAR